MIDNLLKIENPEQEGYTVREENGIKYIEKKEIINHETHGECVSYFQQQIKIDENNNIIIKQRNELYKNNQESTIIESNVVTFENEEFKDKVTENYTNGQLTKQVTNDKKTETIIKYYEYEKEKLVKEIDILDLSHNLYLYRCEKDKKGNVTFQLNSEKIIEHKGEEYPLEQIYSIVSNGEYKKITYLANDKFKIRKSFNPKGDLINIETTDKDKNIVTTEKYTNGKLTEKVTNDKKIETTIKYYEDEKEGLVKEIDILDLSHNLYLYRCEKDKKGNVTYQLHREKIIEHKGEEYPLEHIYNILSNGESKKITYLENDKFKIIKSFNSKGHSIETTDKDKDIITTEIYINGQLKEKETNDKKRGIITTECKTIIGYPTVIVEDKNSNITIKTVYDKSGNEFSITEENKNTGIEIVRYYDKSGNIDSITEENKKTGIKKTTNYDQSGNKTSIREENKNTGIEIYTRYDKSGNKTSIREENKNTGIEIYTRYDESVNKTSIREENKNTGIEIVRYYDKSGNKTSIREKNKNTGIEIDTTYDESGNIKYIIEKNKNKGTEIYTTYDESGNISSIKKEDENTGIKSITYYNQSGNIDYIEEENTRTGERNLSVMNKNKTEVYKLIDGESAFLGLKDKYLRYRDKLNLFRTIEDLEDGGQKISEGNKETYIYPQYTKVVLYREDQNKTRFQSVIDTDNEKVSRTYDISGETIISTLRKTKNMNVEIEELYEKGKLFPVFKVNDIEIPLVSLDKYKEVCQKYNIEPLPEVLAGQRPPRPPAQPKSTI